ncbi:MAG: hypothetical protein WCW26_00375 [Candidatus Buchananbacteria bacterium]
MLSKKIFSISLLLLTLISFFISPITLASTFDVINKGFSDTGSEAGYPVSSGKPTKEFAVAFIGYINGMLGLMGLLFMVFMIFAGYIWMTARGREEKVKRAQTLIIEAVIGLAIVISARLIAEIALTVLGTTLVR